MSRTVNGPIRVGLIGAGGIATAHLRGYAAHADRIGVTAVADVDTAAAAARADEVGATPYQDFRAMINGADIDAVDVCLPHHLHADAIVAAAEAGKHVLCEKPLCLTFDEADRVRRAVADNRVTLMSAHNQLFLPPVAAAMDMLRAGLLGQVYEVRTTDSFHNDFDPSSMGWRAHRSTSGGGELIDTGYHPTYLLLHLAGAAPTEVTAMLSTHRLTFAEGEDSAQVLVRFDNGVLGHLVTSWAYQAADCTEKFSVVGELGALWATKSELSYRLRDGTSETFSHDTVDTFTAEIGHFADCLADGTRPLHNEIEGIQVLGIIHAAYESARTKQVVTVSR